MLLAVATTTLANPYHPLDILLHWSVYFTIPERPEQVMDAPGTSIQTQPVTMDRTGQTETDLKHKTCSPGLP